MLTDLGYPALAKTVYADDWTPSRREYLGYWSDKGPK